MDVPQRWYGRCLALYHGALTEYARMKEATYRYALWRQPVTTPGKPPEQAIAGAADVETAMRKAKVGGVLYIVVIDPAITPRAA